MPSTTLPAAGEGLPSRRRTLTALAGLGAALSLPTACVYTAAADTTAVPLAPGAAPPKALPSDAALLALAPTVEKVLTALRAAYDRHGVAEALHFAKQPSPDYHAAEAAVAAIEDAWAALHDRVADMPARTLAGLQLKVRICNGDPELDPQMMASLAADIMAMGAST